MRPKTKPSEKLDAHIQVRLTTQEKKRIKERCERERFRTLSDFIRSRIFVKREVKLIEVSEDFHDTFSSLDYNLAKLGNNMNQIAHRLNAYNTYMLDEKDKVTIRECYELLDRCYKALEQHMMVLHL